MSTILLRAICGPVLTQEQRIEADEGGQLRRG